MAAKGVYLELRSGVTHATLPDNRSMVAGESYLISVDDFQRLSRAVRESVVDVTGIETKSSVVNGGFDGGTFTDLAGLCNGDEIELDELGLKVGKVVQGINGEAFKLVQILDDDQAAGDVLVWDNKLAGTVKKGTGELAGVLVDDTDENNFGWIQTEGVVSSAAVESAVSAGDNLKVKGSAGTFDKDTTTTGGETVATALSDAATGKAEVALRSTRARNRYFKRPNLFYPGQ